MQLKQILKYNAPTKLLKSKIQANTTILTTLSVIMRNGDIVQPLELYKLKTIPPNNPMQLLIMLRSNSYDNPL